MDDLIIIDNKIYEIRGQKVMLDFDLAKMYEVETKYLKQMVRRNAERFPEDFLNPFISILSIGVLFTCIAAPISSANP